VYRRSGGHTPRFGQAELTAWYQDRLQGLESLEGLASLDLRLDPDTIVPSDERARYMALPGAVDVRDRTVPIEYDVEEGVGGVARLRLPEKIARTLVESELPALDRPLRFVVPRGQRGAVRAASLDELQELLDRPWSPDEVTAEGARRDRQRARDRRRDHGSGERRHGGRGDRGGRSQRRGRRGRR